MVVLVPLVVVAALALLGMATSRPARGARAGRPGGLEWRASRALPAMAIVIGAGFALLATVAALSGNPTATPPVMAFFLGFAAFGILFGVQVGSWRVRADDEGIHVRRWLFGARDVAWADMDALVVRAGRYTPGVPDKIVVVSGGRRAMSIEGLALGGGRATPGQLLDEARRRGVPVRDA